MGRPFDFGAAGICLRLLGEDEPPEAKAFKNKVEVVRSKGKTSFAATQFALHADDLWAHIFRRVDNGGALLGIAVFRIKPNQATRSAVPADIGAARAVST